MSDTKKSTATLTKTQSGSKKKLPPQEPQLSSETIMI